MAQYTPNFNLYEPDSSDDFADFRTEFNNNMDIIDQNLGGGGGSGGHTIYDKDGNALAQESGLQFTGNVSVSDDSGNGRTVVDILGGGGNVYGAFLDPSRVIYSAFTFDSSAHTWTATEDVILTDNLYPVDGSTASYILIDGKGVFASYTFGDPFVYVKKGQVVTYRGKSGSNMKAYGILQGTNGIFAPVIYSDNERVIGVWRDNKPLYQKTIVNHSSDVNGTGILIDVSSLNIDSCVSIEGVCDRNVAGVGTLIYEMNSYEDSGLRTYLGYSKFNQNIQYTIRFYNTETTSTQIITIRYTKTTDGAGSGNWNTDGVPTHHYSTSEQVVGTWINGKPLYEKTIDGGMIIAGANWNTFAHGVTDMDVCTSIEAILVNNTGTNVLNAYRPSLGLGVVIERNGANMRYMNTWFGNNEAQIICTIRYTKTTD